MRVHDARVRVPERLALRAVATVALLLVARELARARAKRRALHDDGNLTRILAAWSVLQLWLWTWSGSVNIIVCARVGTFVLYQRFDAVSMSVGVHWHRHAARATTLAMRASSRSLPVPSPDSRR